MDPALAALLIEQSPDAIIYATPDGNIRGWNAAAVAMFGFSQEEAMGQNLDIIIPEKLREAHWRGFERAFSTGETKYHGEALPTRATKASGEAFYVEMSFGLIRDESGALAGAVAHARDITERFAKERETRQRLRELDAELKELRGAAEPVS